MVNQRLCLQGLFSLLTGLTGARRDGVMLEKNEPERFTGRFLLVAGPPEPRGISSTSKRPFDDEGGQEKVKLTENQMPRHSHVQVWGQGPNGPVTGNNIFGTNTHAPIQSTQLTGGGEPHDNMPPYIALYFCKKEG